MRPDGSCSSETVQGVAAFSVCATWFLAPLRLASGRHEASPERAQEPAVVTNPRIDQHGATEHRHLRDRRAARRAWRSRRAVRESIVPVSVATMLGAMIVVMPKTVPVVPGVAVSVILAVQQNKSPERSTSRTFR